MLTVVAIDLIILVLLLVLGVPLPFCFGGALLFLSLFADVSISGLMIWGFGMITSLVILSAPLFFFAGAIMGESGIGKSLFDFIDTFVGRIKGGLGVFPAPLLS